MKKTSIIAALLTLCLLFAACGQAAKATSSEQQKETATVSQPASATGAASSAVPPANIDQNKEYDYEVREIWVDNNGEKIYGEAYIPVTNGKFKQFRKSSRISGI